MRVANSNTSQYELSLVLINSNKTVESQMKPWPDAVLRCAYCKQAWQSMAAAQQGGVNER